MANHPRAGQTALPEDLIDVASLLNDYSAIKPDITQIAQRVTFGTSGHRGCATNGAFNQIHILAIAQAIVDERKRAGVTGPIFVGKDTHALSSPACESVLAVLTANGVEVKVQQNDGVTPTPAISHAILTYNKNHSEKTDGTALADGIVITPSHNPPQDGGIKYNPSHGGPAEGEITKRIEQAANIYIENNLDGVKQTVNSHSLENKQLIEEIDFVKPYVDDLVNVVDMQAIQKANLHIGVDPLGGAGIDYWRQIATTYQLDIELVNQVVDPTFSFMPLDKDGVIRMDCSSPYAMANLLALKDDYELAFGNDPDYDRHGIVTPQGLMDPNHYLAVCIDYLFRNRPQWKADVKVGKTLVSSAIIDRVVADLGRDLCEVPVGFKWFVDGLHQGEFGFGGEESAGASFLRHDGIPWATDKDGIILCLLGAEITAVTGMNPQQYYDKLAGKHGKSFYRRLQAVASPEQKDILSNMNGDMVKATELAGEKITARLTHASGNNEAIGGLKVTTENGWFAARPSGTENIYKIYCESLKSAEHLQLIEQEAQAIVNQVFKQAGL